MSYKTLSLTIENQIAHLKLARPEALNAMSKSFWHEFPAALKSIDETAEARVILISSTGPHFSAGMDLEVFTSPDPSWFEGEPGRRAEAMRRLVLQLQACFNLLEEVRMPVLTAIQGGCIGGALDLVCASDSRYCTKDAYFVVKETELGMTADLGTLQRLPSLVPPGLARELAYTARKMPAHEALSAGLVNRVFSDAQAMLDGVMEIATQIASRSPLAVTGTKAMINYARDHSLSDSLNHMATWQAGMFQPADIMKTFSASTAGKQPEYEALRPIKPAMS